MNNSLEKKIIFHKTDCIKIKIQKIKLIQFFFCYIQYSKVT